MAAKTGHFLRKSRRGRLALFLILALVIGWWSLRLPSATRAAPILVITSPTWNVVGLDTTNLAASPNQYLVGARVCNDDTAPAANITTVWEWTDSNPNISLAPGQPVTQTLAALPASACRDFMYVVEVSRSAAAVGTERAYRITATGTDADPVSTPENRAVRVEAFTAETVGGAQTLEGPEEVVVGQQYQYVARKSELPAKQQLVQQVLFPYPNFRIVEVDAEYSIPAGATNDRFYADACGWISDTTSADYLTCEGTDLYTGGEVGGTIVTTYTVEVLAQGVYTLTHLIYDYDEEVFHYQSGYGSDSLVINALQGGPEQTATAAALTATAAFTMTQTAQAGTPATFTPTPTITPTPTATGTITPSPVMTYTVNPIEARVGQNMTFNIRVTNNGSAPAMNASVTDSFSTYLDLLSVDTSVGTATSTASLRSFSVNIGTLMPNQSAVITVVVTVNSTTRTNQNLTNTARFTYAYAGLTYTVNSSVSYRLIGSTTLPGTGGLQLSGSDPLGPAASGAGSARWQSQETTNPLVGIARLAALALGGLGAAGILYGWRTRRSKPEWGAWYMKIGSLFAAVGLFFGLASMALSRSPGSLSPPPAAQATEPVPPVANLPGDLGSEGGPRGQYYPVQPEGEPETLPDFPIPTPLVATEEPGEEPVDISAVERIVIPALGVDTIVKYVPFDGITWLIAGLQQEVAWMGDTSWPGLGSNTALAGHVTLRNGAQGPFYELQSLQTGDEIFVYTAEKVYTYRVAEGRTIEETDFSVVAPSEQARLTLITCTEWDEQMRFYLKRYIVGADLVQSRPRTTAAGFVDSFLP